MPSFLRKLDFLILPIILILGLALRLHLLIASDWAIESDEAIVGLMAKHISEGREWPVFYYGQYYMGSIEAFLVSLLFLIFGPSNIALKTLPLIFSILHIWLVFLLASRFTSRFGARAAALFTALAPSALVLWGVKPRGGALLNSCALALLV